MAERMTFRKFLKRLAEGWGWRQPLIPQIAASIIMEVFHPPEEGLGEKEVEVEYRRGGYRDEDKNTYIYTYEWRIRGVEFPLERGVERGGVWVGPLWEKTEEGWKKTGIRIRYEYVSIPHRHLTNPTSLCNINNNK